MFHKLLTATFALATTLTVAAGSRITRADGSVTLANDLTSATFATDKAFDILSMTANGRELVEKGANLAPWTLKYLGEQGETPEMTPATADYQGVREVACDTAKVLEFKWNTRLKYDGNHYPVTMTVSLPDNSPLLHWNIAASLPQGWVIDELLFPTVAIKSPAKGKVITPAGWGNEYTLRTDTVYEANYPSWSASMQMMMLDTPDGTFFYSPRDYRACGKLMTLGERLGQSALSTKTVASHAWSKDGRFSLPWTTVTGFNKGSWADAAKQWYRPWARTTSWGSKKLSDRNIPEWLVDADVWIRAKYTGDTTVTAVNKAIDFYGKNTIFHWYFWHNHPYDSHYPDYLPAKPGFKETVAAVRARGAKVMPYINGRLWDAAAESYRPRRGYEASTRRADGALNTEIYPTSLVVNTVTCPGSQIWHDVLVELSDSIQNGIGTNGLYIDQIAAAAPYPCYATNHNHAKGGGEFWLDSYRQIIDDIRTKTTPEGNIVFSEENAECYIPSFDILLTVNTPHSASCRIIPLYPMMYSDRVLTTAYTYSDKFDCTKGDFRYQNMQALLYGAQLGWVDPILLWKNDATRYEAQYLKNLADFRSKQHDVFVGGEYVEEIIPGGDNPETIIPGFGIDKMVNGAHWRTPAGKDVLFVVNSDSMAHTVTLPSGKELKMKPVSAKRINL